MSLLSFRFGTVGSPTSTPKIATAVSVSQQKTLLFTSPPRAARQRTE